MFGKSAFGSTGGFGQPQQQQQPGSVFGQPAQQPQQGSAFGGKMLDIVNFFFFRLLTTNPTGFGATSAPSAFGAAPATTSAFGQPAQQSAFGAAPATSKSGIDIKKRLCVLIDIATHSWLWRYQHLRFWPS